MYLSHNYPKNLTDWQDAFTEETLEEFIESDDYEETYNRARNITLETNPDAERTVQQRQR